MITSTMPRPRGTTKETVATSYRLSKTGKALLDALTDHTGASATSLIEMMIRDKAREMGVTIPQEQKPKEETAN